MIKFNQLDDTNRDFSLEYGVYNQEWAYPDLEHAYELMKQIL
jgi:hypothetical protein